MSHLRVQRSVARVAAVAAVYYLAGKFGLSLAFVNASASPVWPPTGIALAAIYLLGYRVWPGLWVGAFLVNLTTTGTVVTSLGIATGNTLEGVLGVWLVRRVISGRKLFDHPADVFLFAVFAGVLAPMVSAAMGVTSLTLGGLAPPSELGAIWLTWWLGDVAGALILAPFLILWGESPRDSWSWPRATEAMIVYLALVVAGLLVFGRAAEDSAGGAPLKFLCFPVLIWSAFQFTQRGAATAVVILSVIAVRGTLLNLHSVSGNGLNHELVVLQAFMAVASLSALALGSSVALRRRVEASLRLTTEGLERMMLDRTDQLWAAHREWRKEAAEHLRSRENLSRIEGRLREAEEAARVGSRESSRERQRADEERQRLIREQATRREVEEASRRKDEFLSTLSHELRNPLSAIVVWADLLQRGRLDRARRTRAIEVIRRSAELQGQLVLDLLDLSRITAGQLALSKAPLDVRSVVQAALDSVAPTARGKRVRLAVRSDSRRMMVVADAARLQQVVWNLLSNAIRFTPEGGRVRVTMMAGDAEAVIRVEDDGPGIDPFLLSDIFDRHRRADGCHGRRSDGLGLGLAIVKQLVELHGGSVSAANRKRSTGAVFSVTLPLSGFDPSRAASFERAQPVSRSRSRVEGLEPAAALSGVRILVVEDDPDSREPLALLLAAHGAEVMAVESSARAMATFERQPPDVLISDIAIPDVDGYELLHRVRALPGERGGRVPAIALTAHARADDVSRAIESGYQVHIAKPYDGGHLVSVIGHLLQRVPA